MESRINSLFESLKNSTHKYNIEKIEKAYLFAKDMHEGQFRKSGEPFIIHPVSVAEIAVGLGLDTDSICAALLHDTVEDCGGKVNLDIIKKEFGEQVEILVDGLTKLIQIPFYDKEEEHIENLRKMFLAMSKDIRVIFIKLCDRLHNMRTLYAQKEHKQRMIALETMQVYAPLAHRLGMQRIKQELENISISFLDPVGYEEVKNDIDKKYGQNKDFIENTKIQLSEKLKENGFDFTLDGRVKSVYSVYKKMYEQNKSFDEIYDFYAVRVLTKTELECYTVLGIIHDAFKSVPGRFKDYISTPKPNMYQSLHTTVIGRNGIPFEVQIRTWDMHHIAEYGVAAHWKYKSGESASKEAIDQKLSWIAKLIENEDDMHDHEEFLNALKVDIFHDEIFVFTPKGDVVNMPAGATLIDFAYMIHSAVGNRMIGAKINGAIAPIDSVPQNGQIVEVITSSNSKGPSRDWLKVVKTSEARNKIRQWFKKEKKSENIAVGKAEIERELKKFNLPYTQEQRDEILGNICQRMGVQSLEDLYNTIGYGGLSVSKISIKIKDEFMRIVGNDEDHVVNIEDIVVDKPRSKNLNGIIIDGLDGCEVKFAKCCNPLPGDNIIGFITRGHGISIHKADCRNITSIKEENLVERLVSAHWGNSEQASSAETFEAIIQVYAENDMMLLADLTSAIAEMRVSLHSINTQNKGNGDILINITVGCKNTDHFHSIMSRLKSVNHVLDVKRGYA